MQTSNPKKQLLAKIQAQLEKDLHSYNQTARTNLYTKLGYHQKYGSCIHIYNQHQEKASLIYTITTEGLLTGPNSQTFCANHIKCENIAIRYLCKLIRTFN